MHDTSAVEQKQSRQRAARDGKPPPPIFGALAWVADCNLPDDLRLLLFVLARYCDPNGSCFPRNDTLARHMRCSTRTIKRMLKRLIEANAISVPESGRGRAAKRTIRLNCYGPKWDSCRRSLSHFAGPSLSRLNGTRFPCSAPPKSQTEEPSTTTAAATPAAIENESDGEFVARLQNRYPNFNVRNEQRKYCDFCTSKGRTPRRKGFEVWMARAEPALNRPELTAEEWSV